MGFEEANLLLATVNFEPCLDKREYLMKIFISHQNCML